MARTTSVQTQVALLEQRLTGVESSVNAMELKLDTVLTQQAKYKGFWGAATIIVSAVWAAVTFFFPNK